MAVLPIFATLSNFADVDFGIEIGGECLVVVTCIAVDDVEVLNLVEMVLGGIGGVDAAHARVEATTEDGAQAGLLESLLVGPLPRVLEVGLVFRLIVGGVEIVASAGEACLHDGEVLIGEGEVDYQQGFVVAEERFELFHIVGVYLCRLDVERVAGLMDGLHDVVALLLGAAGNHHLGENVGILCDFKRCYGGHATGAYHQYSAHFFMMDLMVIHILIYHNSVVKKKIRFVGMIDGRDTAKKYMRS